MLKTDKLTLETTIVQCPGYIISDMDGETVMMSIDNGKYYNLGVIGGFIWGIINNPITISKVISKITAEFDVEDSKCQKDVIPFLENLLKEKLIKVQNDL